MKKLKLFCSPVTLLFLGAAPALAASADVRAALGMSLAVLFVLLCSALVLALLRRLLPAEARFAAILLTVAGFASMAQLLLHALLPSAYALLGLYAAVLGVDLMLFGAGETGAERGLGSALISGLFFALFVLILSAVREIFGAASFAGNPIEFLAPYKIPLLTQASGGLILFSILLAVVNKLFPGGEEAGELTRAAAGLKAAEKEA